MFGLARERTDLLFCNVDWHNFQEERRSAARKEIEAYHPDRFLNTSTHDLVAYFTEKYSINVPVLLEEKIRAEQEEKQIDVSQDANRFIRDRSRPYHMSGTLVQVEVPYSGDAQLFRVQPQTFSLNPPRADIRENHIVLRIEGIDLSPENVRKDIDRRLSDVKENLGRLRQSAEEANRRLEPFVKDLIENRKAKLLKDRSLVASLGFPLKEREGASRTYAAPEIKRKAVPTPPPANTAPYKPEPALTDKEYEHILVVLEQMVTVMERSPSAFHAIDEEALRMHFLMQLNGHYEGQATGETFNYEGKTDILIRSAGKNIFIAECKFWKGAKKYSETIDQLLSYLSWRDSKAALIVFNRNKDFSRVLEEIQRVTPEHPNCKTLLRQRSETSWQYLFAHRDDPNQEMIITVLAFDVPGD